MSLILQHPTTAPTTTVTLPNPEFGDAERPTYGNVFAYNRTGALLNAADADHPTTRTRQYTIRKITDALRDSLQDFLQDTAGQLIKVTDYNSNTYNALVTSENVEFITTRDGGCDNEVTLELMEVE